MNRTRRAILLLTFCLPAGLVTAADPATTPPQKPWLATGTVLTSSGEPLPNVDIIAHTGMGSRRVGGRTTTRPDGTFELPFGPGFWSKDGEGFQVATISVHKDGWFETNLYRQGDLVAAFKLPKGEIGWGKKTTNDVFLPGQAKTLKFTMAPAAEIKGRLVDRTDAPLPQVRVGLTGNTLPPSSSVFAEIKTNERGEFTFKNLPTTLPLKLYVESMNENWRKWPALTIKLNEAKRFTVRLEP